jgi:hypothetical protein
MIQTGSICASARLGADHYYNRSSDGAVSALGVNVYEKRAAAADGAGPSALRTHTREPATTPAVHADAE